MKILAICRGQPEILAGKSYKTGINKVPVGGAVLVDREGLLGDTICNRKHHGGPDQAIYIEGAMDLSWWAEELGRPVPPGQFGENLTIESLENGILAVGDRLRIGEVVLEVTAPRIPCATFAARMNDASLVKRYTMAARPGAYCRVIAPGVLTTGQTVEHLPYQGERLTLVEMMAAYGKSHSREALTRYLRAPLAERFRKALEAKSL